jgi:hypothetical protein
MRKFIIPMLCIATGMAISFLIARLNEEKGLEKTNFSTNELREISADSLQSIMDTTEAILNEKQPNALDSIKMVGAVRDSLLDVKGRITSSMLSVIKQPDTYKKLDALRYNLDVLIDSCDNIIMQRSLDLLKSTNTGLRALVKQIKDKTEELKNIAKTTATIADVVSAITNILAAPVLAPVTAAAPVAQ